MTSISIIWATLDPSVQQWLLQNPGTMVLPRTYVNMVAAGVGDILHLDEHGEYWLSPEDMLFLAKKRHDHPKSVTSPSPHLVAAVASHQAARAPLASHENALDQ